MNFAPFMYTKLYMLAFTISRGALPIYFLYCNKTNTARGFDEQSAMTALIDFDNDLGAVLSLAQKTVREKKQ